MPSVFRFSGPPRMEFGLMARYTENWPAFRMPKLESQINPEAESYRHNFARNEHLLASCAHG